MPNSISTTSKTQATSRAHQASHSLDDGLSMAQISQRRVIDLTAPNDDEVILLSSHDLSHIACDISGAATVLHDVGHLLALIHYNKIDAHTAQSMARLAHDAADTWADLLHSQLKSINKPLAQTAYGKEGSQ